jgi:hypothetical protein
MSIECKKTLQVRDHGKAGEGVTGIAFEAATPAVPISDVGAESLASTAAKERFKALPSNASQVPQITQLLASLRSVPITVSTSSGKAHKGCVAAISTRQLPHGEQRSVVSLLQADGTITQLEADVIASFCIDDAVVRAAYLSYLTGDIKMETESAQALAADLTNKTQVVISCGGPFRSETRRFHQLSCSQRTLAGFLSPCDKQRET